MEQRRPPRVGPRTNILREPGAWSVRVERGGRVYNGHCADAVYGGRQQSHLAARRFRDGLLRRIEPDTRVRRRVPRGSRSQTDVVGVILERYLVDGREYERFVAHWRDPYGRQLRRRFSLASTAGRGHSLSPSKRASKVSLAPGPCSLPGNARRRPEGSLLLRRCRTR